MRTTVMLLTVCLLSAASSAWAGPPKVSDRLPLAARILAESDLSTAPTTQLLGQIRRLTNRLLLGDEDLGLDTPADLHDLVLLATTVQVVVDRGETSRGLDIARMTTSFMVHAVGYTFDTQPTMRESLSQLLEQVPSNARDSYVDLLASLRAMRQLGKDWFPHTLHAVLDRDRDLAIAHNQRGHWLDREKRPADAAAAFQQAFVISEAPHHAINLHRTLLKVDKPEAARRLYERVTDGAPGLAARLDLAQQRYKDEQATRAYEAGRDGAPPAVAAAQLASYQRLGRLGPALFLAKQLVADHPTDLQVQQSAADLYLSQQRFGSLLSLVDEAEQSGAPGGLDAQLRDARIAAIVHARVTADPQLAAIAARDLDSDLAALKEREPERGALVGHAARILLAIGQWKAANERGEKTPTSDVLNTVKGEVAAGLKAFPRSLTMARLALAAYVGVDRPDQALKTADTSAKRLKGDDRLALRFMTAQVRAGYGVQRGDKKLVRRALATYKTLRREFKARGALADPDKMPPGMDLGTWHLATVTAQLASQTLDGAPLDAKDAGKGRLSAEEAINRLPKPRVAFDESSSAGRKRSLALVATLGALLVSTGNHDVTPLLLKQVRRLEPKSSFAKLAAGQAAVMTGDPAGARGLLDAGLTMKPAPGIGFLTLKWLSYASNLMGDKARGAEELRLLLNIWDLAGVPDVVQSRSPRPVFMGDFSVSIHKRPGMPLEPRIEIVPVIALVPDVAHDRKALRAAATE